MLKVRSIYAANTIGTLAHIPCHLHTEPKVSQGGGSPLAPAKRSMTDGLKCYMDQPRWEG